MSLNKAVGNMYPWVTHTWSCLHGACPHRCTYCYVKRGRTKGLPCYQGLPRFNERDHDIVMDCGKVIFVAHTSDLFAEGVPTDALKTILALCRKYRFNEYVFQTKNPRRAVEAVDELPEMMAFGTTIETDDWSLLRSLSKAPHPFERGSAIEDMGTTRLKKPFSQEEQAIVRKYYGKVPTKDIALALTKRFGVTRTCISVQKQASKMGLSYSALVKGD